MADYIPTRPERAFLEKICGAVPPDLHSIDLYRCAGPAGSARILERSGRGSRYIPLLRGRRLFERDGVEVPADGFATVQEAEAAAAKALEHLRKVLLDTRLAPAIEASFCREHAEAHGLAVDGLFRIARLFHLGMLCTDPEFDPGDDEELVEALIDASDRTRILPEGLDLGLTALRGGADGFEDWERVWERLRSRGHLGFLAIVETPVRSPARDGKTVHYSWGHTTTMTVYADTIDGIAGLAASFSRDVEARAQRKGRPAVPAAGAAASP